MYTKGTMMSEAILNFPKQFAFSPVVENAGALRPFTRVLICGMGGSHLAADLLPILVPDRLVQVHSDYGLPAIDDSDRAQTLVVLSSYSGNTEEVLEVAVQAKEQGLNCAVIAVGGQLLAMAKANNWPFVALPDTGIQPRSAMGFSVRALLTVLGETAALEATAEFAQFDAASVRAAGQALAARLKDHVPVIYAARPYFAMAYNWKIKCNETGKIPAFCNAVPELNHNEMNGFDYNDASRELSRPFHFIFLESDYDHPMNQKRFAVLAKLYQDRQFSVERIRLNGRSAAEAVFANLLLADWTALHIAEANQAEAEQVPMVEEFKKLIRV